MDSSVLPEPLCTLLKSALGASASVLLEPLCTVEKSAFLSPPPGASDSESGSLGFLGLLIGASCAASAVGRVPRRLLSKFRAEPYHALPVPCRQSPAAAGMGSSAELRVGKEWVSRSRTRWGADH